MPAINCPHCGGEMYEGLNTCPHCGDSVNAEMINCFFIFGKRTK